MDLEKYKKSWEDQPEEANRVSKLDIYKMAHSRSSSIVKWIFIIGILELIFWTGLNFIVPDKYVEIYNDFNLMGFLKIYTVLHYVVILLFLILFYKNYSSITITDNTKKLMNKILRVRKTVKYYVYYNLAGLVITNIIVSTVFLSNPDTLVKSMNPEGLDVDASTLLSGFLIATIALVLIMFLILWLFYKVTYGKLLKKLNKNYKELNHLETIN
ncbi:MAG: hypothetical protein JKZ00_02930 [Flavobacteriaceae bacterium]|nr:hypothetical protein [Flavobacteriaceae bacterium]